jgi:two-component system chemotaxis response regulator CheB
VSSRRPDPYQAVVIGGSAGSTKVLLQVLSSVPTDACLPIIVCTHVHASDRGGHAEHLNERCEVNVVEAHDKQPIEPGTVYVAPANYHLLVERHKAFALSIDERVQGSRPSIDVLFESAAHTFGAALVGILLSGANQDGAEGLLSIAREGGLTIAQDPSTTEHPTMPQAAIDRQAASEVLSPEKIQNSMVRFHARARRIGKGD